MKHKYSTMFVGDIEICITQKKMKSLRLKVCPKTGKVQVSAPVYAFKKEIQQFVKANLSWIEAQRIKAKKPPVEIEAYGTGDKISILGDEVELNITRANIRSGIVFNETLNSSPKLTLSLLNPNDYSEQVNLIEKWQRQYLKQKIDQFIQYYQPIMGVKVTFFGVKKMRTRWGSCNIPRKRIWIGFDLINKPLHCLEYVVVHELAHLLETNHTPKFWQIVEQYFPLWKQSHTYLNK